MTVLHLSNTYDPVWHTHKQDMPPLWKFDINKYSENCSGVPQHLHNTHTSSPHHPDSHIFVRNDTNTKQRAHTHYLFNSPILSRWPPAAPLSWQSVPLSNFPFADIHMRYAQQHKVKSTATLPQHFRYLDHSHECSKQITLFASIGRILSVEDYSLSLDLCIQSSWTGCWDTYLGYVFQTTYT